MEVPNLPQVVTEAVAAKILGVSPRTLQDWRFRGRGPAYMAYSRKAIRYRVEDLTEFMQASERTSDDPAVR